LCVGCPAIIFEREKERLNNLEKATKRNTSKGRLGCQILALATPKELVEAETVFGRTALSYADVELFFLPILSRAGGHNIQH